MKILLTLLVAVPILSQSGSVPGWLTLPARPPYGMLTQEAVEAVPPLHAGYDLTVKDIVTILSEFDVKHVDQQPFFAPAYGVTDFSSNPPAIWIFNKSDSRDRKSTVIHELLHTHYRQAGVTVTEEFIASEEDRLYNKIFGVVPE